MRIASASGQLMVGRGDEWIAVERASAGRFAGDPQLVYDRWDEFVAWVDDHLADAGDEAVMSDLDSSTLDVPVPRPRQVIAIGLNYREHATEAHLAEPEYPVVFTKFPSSLTGHGSTVLLPSDRVDWEVELVVVIGRQGHRIPREKAWDYVAGLTVGQDLSWREVQTRGPVPQFAMGKSYPGFSPLGPVVVTPDEFEDRNDLSISCSLDGEVLQQSRTSDLIFPVDELIAYLSEALTLYPGDVIYTGTPGGVGASRNPQRYLESGQLVSTIEGIGDLSVQLRTISRSNPLPGQRDDGDPGDQLHGQLPS